MQVNLHDSIVNQIRKGADCLSARIYSYMIIALHINSTLKGIVQETLVKYAVGLFPAALDHLDDMLCFLACKVIEDFPAAVPQA